MPTPIVIEGLRAPYEARKTKIDGESRPDAIHSTPAIDPQVGTKYLSKFRLLRVSLVPPRRQEVMPGVHQDIPGVNAIFEDHMYVNTGGNDPDPKKRAEQRELIDQLMKRNPWYGIKSDFWLDSDMQQIDTKNKIDSAVAAIRKDPEAVKALINQLQSEGALDWTLPTPVEKAGPGSASTQFKKLE